MTLDSSSKAIERVAKRVALGGHGIPDDIVRKRYIQSHNNLPKIASKSDNVFIYDNSDKFKMIYTRKNNIVFNNELPQYPWVHIDKK